MTRILDSSLVFAAFDAAEPRRAEALRQLEDPGPIAVPPEVVSETLGILQRRHGFAAASAVWEQLQRIPHVQLLDESDAVGTASAFLAAKGQLSWTDAVVVNWCRRKSAAPMSFDSHIDRALRRR